ncbi:MAG: aminotransferase class I/II-fold pyridoxal phosphate-dependent enzyme [Actinomycetota bacterium]
MAEIALEPFSEAELRRLSGIKWRRDGDAALPAWVADMDIRSPACIRDAVTDLVAAADLGYNRAVTEAVTPAFVSWQERHHGWTPDLDRLQLFCDVLHAIDTALWLHTEPGDGIVLLTPVYPPFLKAVADGGRRLVDVPLDPDGWRLDPERLAAAIDDSTRAILLCSPHNPTGRVFDPAELAAIAEVAERHDLLIISDEVWADLLHPGADHTPMATLGPEVENRTLTISSASKAFNTAGLRCAVAHIGHPGLHRAIDSLPQHYLGAVSSPGAVAAVAAWEQGEPWLALLRDHLGERRRQLAARLAAEAPEIGWQQPEATYLAWLDLRATAAGRRGDIEPAELVRAETGLVLSPGPDFGVHGSGFARLNFATSAEILDRIVDRLVAGVAATGG